MGMGMGDTSTSRKRIRIPDDNPKRIVDLTKRSVDFVKEHAGERPFFLMVSHYAVHVPHQASPEAIERCRQRWLAAGKPDVDRSQPGYEQTDTYQQWQYSAMLEETDQSLGSIIDSRWRKPSNSTTPMWSSPPTTAATSTNPTQIISVSTDHLGKARGRPSKAEFASRLWCLARESNQDHSATVPVIQWDLLPTLHDLADSQDAAPCRRRWWKSTQRVRERRCGKR